MDHITQFKKHSYAGVIVVTAGTLSTLCESQMR